MLHNSGDEYYPPADIPQSKEKERKTESKSSVKIEPIETKKSLIKQPNCSINGTLPKHPFRLYIVGASGSGKTNCLVNLLKRKEFYKGYFDDIFVFSMTAMSGLDDSYDDLEIDESHFLPPEERYIQEIFRLQKLELKKLKDISKLSKILFVMDDVQSYQKFVGSEYFLKMYLMGRHLNISIVLCGQSYTKLPRACRLNCSALMYFKGSQNETLHLAEDYQCPNLSKKQMVNMINYATEKKYSFLFIDLFRDLECRYKKNLDEVIDINKYNT